ncbi:MAG: hypothetical protein KDK90_12740 [Leptospiraceae bacterium]|nr:hypothetical protein [Leptospiraceae bacterium]
MKDYLISFLVFMFFIAGNLGACAVCTDGSGYDQNTLNAYYFITVLLSVIPVSIGLTVLFIIRRRIKQREEKPDISTTLNVRSTSLTAP